MGNKSYKAKLIECKVGDVEAALDSLTNLGSECREIVDNAPDGLRDSDRISTFDETASALEGIFAMDIPECVTDLDFNVQQMVSARKGRGESRAVQRDNEVAILEGALERVRTALDEDEITVEDERDEADTFATELESVIDDVRDVEFPGMFG